MLLRRLIRVLEVISDILDSAIPAGVAAAKHGECAGRSTDLRAGGEMVAASSRRGSRAH